MLKEQKKVDEGIFDEKTMVYLSKFFNLGIIATLEYPIARGKEADVYIATPGKADSVKGMDYVIIKFFRIETSSFFKMENYIHGDPRFEKKPLRKGKFGIIMEWCKKEFGNLELAKKAKVKAPTPLMFNGSILAMSFIGEKGAPAPQLKDCDLKDPEDTLEQILASIRALYKIGLVHADVSEYNVLMSGNTPYMIDFGQAVVVQHPNAIEFLKRDVNNIISYFSKRYGVQKSYEEAIKGIVK